MSEVGEEGTIVTKQMDEPLEEREGGPSSIDVTCEQLLTVEAPTAKQEVQDQNKQIEQAQEESKNNNLNRIILVNPFGISFFRILP